MTQPAAEVRVKLVTDDHSSATVEKVRQGLHNVEGAAHDAGRAASHGMGAGDGILKSMHGGALATAAAVALLAVGLHEGYESAKQLGEAAVEAANEYQKQVKAMSGVLMLIDAGAHSMKDIKAYAADVHEELEMAGLKMGVAVDKMDDAFNSIMERGGLGSEQAKELAVDMALVGKVTRGGMDGLANGFAMIEMGVIKARNPIVQLVAATKTLEGNAHQVAAAMMKMTPEKQMELAQKAIEKQSHLMKQGGTPQLGLDGVKQSMSGVREMFLVSMGKPMLDALLPPLNRVQQFLVKHVEAIEEWGTKIGNKFAAVIGAVSAAAEGVYDGIVLSWDRIQKSFDEIFGEWSKAWDQASGDTANIKSTFASMTEDLILAFELGAKIMKATAEVFMDIKDALSGDAVGKTTAGIAGQAAQNSASNSFGSGSDDAFQKSLDKYREQTMAANGNAEAVEKWIVDTRDYHDKLGQVARAAGEGLTAGNETAEQFNSFITSAMAKHQEGAAKYALSILHGSERGQEALQEAGQKMAGGMDAMMKIIQNLDPELAKEMKKKANPLSGVGVKAPVVHNNFSGAISIKQDFRDQDPDRIALVFKRDLEKHAMARTTARTGPTFGL